MKGIRSERRIFRQLGGCQTNIFAWLRPKHWLIAVIMLGTSSASGQVISTDSLVTVLAESGQRWTQFLTVPTLRTGIYRLEAGSTDTQSPHDRDEVYFVISGTAQVTIEDQSRPVRAHDVIFVKAHVPHRFEEITEDLVLLVFFTEATEDDP